VSVCPERRGRVERERESAESGRKDTMLTANNEGKTKCVKDLKGGEEQMRIKRRRGECLGLTASLSALSGRRLALSGPA
jgi:hypothetical protein